MKSSKTTGELNIIELSDIHLGHRNTKADFIINNLNKIFKDSEEIADVDLIIIAGDLFDNLISYHDPVVKIIELWLVKLLFLCKKHDIALRILEGTPSHDWKQCKNIESLNKELFNIDADYKYIDTLSVIHEPKWDKWFIYVPDEYHPDTNVTYKETIDLLRFNQIEQADYAIMHGAFEYQYGGNFSAPVHNQKLWEEIVKKWIFIGHVHTHSQNGKVIAAGSFDRLRHNEEEDKGLIWVKNNKPKFIKNKNAKIYKTFNMVGVLPEKAMELANKLQRELPTDSHIKFKVGKDDTIKELEEYLKQFTRINWKIEVVTDKVSAKDIEKEVTTKFKAIDLNKNNLPSILQGRLENIYDTEDKVIKSLELLREVL